MSISKRGNKYVELDDRLRTANLKDAKVEVTITVTCGKKTERECTRSIEKFISNQMDGVSKDFKKFIKKQTEKLLGEE